MSDAIDQPLLAGDARGSGNSDLEAILERARRTTDYTTYMSLCRKRSRLKPPPEADAKLIRILGGGTSDFLSAPLQLELESNRINARVESTAFNAIVSDLLNPLGAAGAGPADLAIVLPTPFNISDWPEVGASRATVEALATRTCDEWLAACARYAEITGAEIVLGNFHLLPRRNMGNIGAVLAWDRNQFIRILNAELARRAPDHLHILDLDMLASYHGVSNWFDPRYWFSAKQPVSFDCVVPFVRVIGSIIGAIYGRTAKCVVLDLDNTLWGGVVGDDGIEGIKIGEGDPEGEAFKSFQTYLKSLSDRGLLLAVSSKNDPRNARAPFEALDDMVLKLEDFVAFKANWEPKPKSLKEIAEELNIGLDSLVFVDDNPAEREIVRQMLPEVRVVDLSTDPADYPDLVEATGWLEIARLTEEDRVKVDQYRENLARRELEISHDDYGVFLASLQQRALLRPFLPADLDRVVQLINKTNQFNLTTKRMTRAEVEPLLGHGNTVTASVRLKDRFGDNGLISAIIARRDGADLDIDLWLMSCRVLKRGVEQLLANHLFAAAREMGATAVRGTYIPTARNAMVAGLYADLGFALVDQSEDGTTVWRKAVEDHVDIPVHIEIEGAAQ